MTSPAPHWWGVTRERSSKFVTYLPFSEKTEEFKHRLTSAGRFQLVALDAFFRPVPNFAPRSVSVTAEEAKDAQARALAEGLGLLIKGARFVWDKLASPPAEEKQAWSWPPPPRRARAKRTAPPRNEPPPPRQEPPPPKREPQTPEAVLHAARRFRVSAVTVTEPELRARRRELAQRNHPDARKDKHATEAMQNVNRDFNTLRDWIRARTPARTSTDN